MNTALGSVPANAGRCGFESHPALLLLFRFRKPPLQFIIHNPYRGLGSGIKRALAEWAKIEFTNDEDAGLFTSTIQRESSGEIGKTAIRNLQAIQLHPSITIPELSNEIGITERASSAV